MTIQWCDPPPSIPRIRWDCVFAELKARPGEWALVRTYETLGRAQDGVSHPRKVRPAGGWEVVARRLVENEPAAGVWARYLGPEES